jgi:hypothetical protein
MPKDGELSFEGYNTPHPADLDHSAEEAVHFTCPGLAERNPEEFAGRVAIARQTLDILEGDVARDG